jgi:hypothetical protein
VVTGTSRLSIRASKTALVAVIVDMAYSPPVPVRTVVR